MLYGKAIFALPGLRLKAPHQALSRLEATVIHLIRGLVLQSLMWTDSVVVLDVLTNQLKQLPGSLVFIEVDAFVFQAAEPPLNHDVVSPSPPTIHALSNAQLF